MPPALDIRLIMDNDGTHKTPTILRWLGASPRFHVPFTPASAPWIDPVERGIATLTDRCIRRGAHRSTQDPGKAIRTDLAVDNETPQPLAAVKTVDDILAGVER